MKVSAYITDCCNQLKKGEDVVGLSTQPDLIDKYNSFPTVPNAEKTDIHYCLHCYNKFVINTAGSLVNRKDNEDEYIYLLKVHGYNFKLMVINNYNKRGYKAKKDEKSR